MASGKQLSFQHGEVSPAQRFKSNSVGYNEGLTKLKNMYVRRDGGVSNRPGFYNFGASPYQYDVSELYNRVGIRTVYVGGEEYTIVKKEDRDYLLVNNFEIDRFSYEGQVFNAGVLIPPGPEWARIIPTKDGVFIPGCNFEGCYITGSFDINSMTADVLIENGVAHVIQRYATLETNGTVTKGFNGKAPFIPVSYLITATMNSGLEVIITAQESTGFTFNNDAVTANPSGNALCHPHVEMTSSIKVVFAAASEIADVKYFNLYRAPGQKGLGQSAYRLAGRVSNSKSLEVSFTDYGSDNPSITPPVDMTHFYSHNHIRQPFIGTEVGCEYQQRLIISGSFIPNLKKGEALASAIGAPKQLAGPIVSSNTGAFEFSLPIQDGSYITGMLSMDRLLIGSLKGVYVIRGGDFGILTPSTVNPVKISDEGWSDKVEATMSGSRGFWLNAARTKLMSVSFGVDSNLNIIEASVFAHHLLKDGITQMVSVGGEDNAVFLLTKKGQLVRATVVDGTDVFGFSTYETNGFIESIFSEKTVKYSPDGSGEKSPDTLSAYVIRKGVRYREKLALREDFFPEQEVFSDSATVFGTYLMRNKAAYFNGYNPIVLNTPWHLWNVVDFYNVYVNIMPGNHSWGAYETIKIRTNLELMSQFTEQDFVLHFYHDAKDSNGKTILDRNEKPVVRTLRYVPNKFSLTPVGHMDLLIQGIRITAHAVGAINFTVNIRDLGSFGAEFATLILPEQIDIYVNFGTTTVSKIIEVLEASFPISGNYDVELETGDGTTIITKAETRNAYHFAEDKFLYEYSGHFTDSVPEELRDIAGTLSPDTYEYYLGLTRWLPAFDVYKSPDLKALYDVTVGGPISLVLEGTVVSSPLNPNKQESFSVEFDGTDYFINFGDFYAWGYAGLPYESEMETLDIEAGDNRTLTDAKKILNAVGVGFMETRGGFFGMPGRPLEEMEELVTREDGDMYAMTVNKNGYQHITIPSEWTQGGRVSIKNVDPVPMTILAVYPKGIAGD